jgi:phosphoglycerate dehydrogenase-like enzyme
VNAILVTGQFSAENIERMRQAAPAADLRFVPRLNPGDDGLGDVEAIAGTINANQLAQAPRLKWVHSWAAGVDNDLFPEMHESPVVLTSSHG